MQHWGFWMVDCDVCVRATVVGTDRNGNDVPEHCPLCGSMKVMVITYWEHDMDFYCVKCGEKRGMKHNKEDA